MGIPRVDNCRGAWDDSVLPLYANAARPRTLGRADRHVNVSTFTEPIRLRGGWILLGRLDPERSSSVSADGQRPKRVFD